MSGFLRRPLGVAAAFAALLAAGLLALPRLPRDLLPPLPTPFLTVITIFENAPPQEVEALVTRRLESVLGTVAGLRFISSTSAQGYSRLNLEFAWGFNVVLAAAEVREKLDLVADQLPRRAEPPLVIHYDPAQAPLMTLALSGPSGGLGLRRLARDLVQAKLRTLSGVASLRLAGGLVPEVAVKVDRDRLAAQRLGLGRLVERVEAANLNFPGGELRLGRAELMVRTVGRFARPADITQVPLSKTGVLVGDVASVALTARDRQGFARVGGRPAVLISLLKEPEANAVEVSARVRRALKGIAAALPRGHNLTVVDDQGPFIAGSLAQVRDMVLWGGLLAFAVLLAFMRRPLGALLVVLAAPISLLATFGVMALCRVGLNLMSIGGLALGVGMLVDSSVVVLEAIGRQPAGGGYRQAVAAALAEVSSSLLAATLTTLAALAPLVFLGGLTQSLFSDFAFSLAASLLFSLATALFLLPALALWLGPRAAAPTPAAHGGGYGQALAWVLDYRALTLLIALALVAAAALGLAGLGFDLLPRVGPGRVQVHLALPPESSLASLRAAVEKVEKAAGAWSPKGGVLVRAGVEGGDALERSLEPGGPGEAFITFTLKDPTAQKAALAALRKDLAGLPIRVSPAPSPLLPGRRHQGRPELLSLSGPDLATLRRLAASIKARLAELGFLSEPAWQGAGLVPQLRVKVDRPAAAAAGLSVERIAKAVQTAVEGSKAGHLIQGDREIDIRVRLRPQDRTSPADLTRLPLIGRQDEMVLLGQVARLVESKGPRQILRRERRRALVLRAGLKGVSFSRAQAAALSAAGRVKLPAGYRLEPGRHLARTTASLGSLTLGLSLALLLVYVVMVIQFESLRWPLVILLALPAIMVLPALALHLVGGALTAMVILGGVVLLGIAVNNSILLVDYVNRLVGQGLDREAALRQGAQVRLRPIVISSLTTMVGALPLCLGWTGGAALSRPLAITVVAGLAGSMVFSLLLVPVLYSLLAGRRP